MGGSDRGQDQCPVGIDHAHFCHDHILHDVDDVTLIQQGNDDDRVDRLGTGEAYLCQTERRHCGEYHLTHGNGYGNKDAVEYIAGERHPQVRTEPEHGTVIGQRGIDDVQLRREHEQFLHRLQGHDHCQINGQCHEQCQHQQKDENADSAADPMSGTLGGNLQVCAVYLFFFCHTAPPLVHILAEDFADQLVQNIHDHKQNHTDRRGIAHFIADPAVVISMVHNGVCLVIGTGEAHQIL